MIDIKIECLDNLNDDQKREWREFLQRSQHQHPRQDPKFSVVERATGKDVLFAIGRQNGTICAVGLFTLFASRFRPGRVSVACALSGPVCDEVSTLVAFVQGIAAHPRFAAVDTIKITPYWLDEEASPLSGELLEAGFKISDPKPYRDTGMIDLTMSEEELRASFSRSARRKVRLVEKSEIEIRQINTLDAALEFFERLNTLVIDRHNLTAVTLPEQTAGFKEIYNDPTIGAIFAAYHQERFLGGLLLYRSERTAHARRYVADPGAAQEVQNLRVAPILWLEGLFWAKRQGCVQFDVEGFFPTEDKNHPRFNVYEYKREFKPSHVKRIAEHTLVLNRLNHTLNVMPQRIKEVLKRIFPKIEKFSPKRLFRSRGR